MLSELPLESTGDGFFPRKEAWMNRLGLYFSLLLVFAGAVSASCDDQQKACRELAKVTAMAMDPAGKRAVSLAASEMLLMERMPLVRERHQLNITYGDLFLLYQLVKRGANMNDLAPQMKSGKTVWQIAAEMHPDWREITNEAKKLNNRIDANLLKHFANQKAGTALDQTEGYDPFLDSVNADANVSQKDLDDAQKRYVFLRDHTRVISDSTLDTSTEKSARMVRTDPVRTGGPSNTDTNTRPAPRN